MLVHDAPGDGQQKGQSGEHQEHDLVVVLREHQDHKPQQKSDTLGKVKSKPVLRGSWDLVIRVIKKVTTVILSCNYL